MKMTKEELAEFLAKECEYPPHQAPDTADKLLKMEPGILAAFETWMESGEYPDAPAHAGFTPKSLTRFAMLKPPAVFLLLDWIRRDPNEATEAMQRELVK